MIRPMNLWYWNLVTNVQGYLVDYFAHEFFCIGVVMNLFLYFSLLETAINQTKILSYQDTRTAHVFTKMTAVIQHGNIVLSDCYNHAVFVYPNCWSQGLELDLHKMRCFLKSIFLFRDILWSTWKKDNINCWINATCSTKNL